MIKPFQLRVRCTIVGFIAIGNLLMPSARADDAVPREDSLVTTMAGNSMRKFTMSQSQMLLNQRLDRMQLIRQIQGSNQIWLATETVQDVYQEALALTWQDFWQQQNCSIDTFNQLLQVHYANQSVTVLG